MAGNQDRYMLWVNLLIATGKSVVTTKEIRVIMKQHNLVEPQWFTKDTAMRAGRGKYHVPFAPKG